MPEGGEAGGAGMGRAIKGGAKRIEGIFTERRAELPLRCYAPNPTTGPPLRHRAMELAHRAPSPPTTGERKGGHKGGDPEA